MALDVAVEREALGLESPALESSIREGRRERRARETRRKILEAALELFMERDVESVTVDEIAERADVARGTVFNYFAGTESLSTKESLCHGMGELQLEQLHEAIREGRIHGPTVSEKLEQAMRQMGTFSHKSPEQCRMILLRSLGSIKPGELPEHRKQLFALIQSWVMEGQRTGELRDDSPTEELAVFIMGLQLQATLLWACGFLPGNLADHQIRMLRLALQGLRKNGPEAGCNGETTNG